MRSNPAGVAAKVVAGVAVLLCLLVGAIGIVLPIVPGIVFLALGALIAARFSPALERALRRNRALRGYLDKTAGFERLSAPQQIELGALLVVKAGLDGLSRLAAVCSRVLGRAP